MVSGVIDNKAPPVFGTEVLGFLPSIVDLMTVLLVRNVEHMQWRERTALAYNGPKEKKRVISARILF